jgi:phage-related tail protein
VLKLAALTQAESSFFPQQHIHNPNQNIKELRQGKKRVKDILKGNSIPPIKVLKSLVNIEVSQWTSQTLLCDYLTFSKGYILCEQGVCQRRIMEIQIFHHAKI